MGSTAVSFKSKNHLAGSKTVKTIVRKLILYLLNNELCGVRPAFCICQAADFLTRHTVFVSGRRPGVSLELSHSGLLILFVFIGLKKICAPYRLPVFHSVFMRKYRVTDAGLSKMLLTMTLTAGACPGKPLWKGLLQRGGSRIPQLLQETQAVCQAQGRRQGSAAAVLLASGAQSPGRGDQQEIPV